METIRVYSVYKIDSLIKQWRTKFPLLSIDRIYIPSEDCYVIYKYGTKKNIEFPLEAVIGAQKGFVTGWIKKPFNDNRIFQPTEFEAKLQELTSKYRDEIGTKS